MRKRYFVSLLILIVTLVVDQLTKRWGLTLPSLHFNQGLIMGIYSGLPDNIRIVTLGCFSGLIFFFYVLMMYVLPARAEVFKYGLSFIVGGMFGSVIDKIVYGRTVDFIPITLFGQRVVFNVADIFLWIGVGLCFYIIFRKEKLLWYPDSERKKFLIWPKEQFKVALNFSLLVFCSSLILGIFSFTFFNTTLETLVAQKEHLMMSFFLTYLVITLLFCSMAFVAGIVISHKSAGPLYAFEQYVDDLMEGKDRKLTFRDGDNYRDLEMVGDRLREFIKKSRQG